MSARFVAVHPVLPVRDVLKTLEYFRNKLGFTIAFVDNPKNPMYAGVRRDDVEIHMQWHSEQKWETMTASSLRFVVEDIDSLYTEYKKADVFHRNTLLRETTWNTQEFAFYDLDMNGLTFYRDL